MTQKTFTLRDVAQIMMEDPLPQGRGYYIKTSEEFGEDDADGFSCAMGGVAIQLGVTSEDIQAALTEIPCDAGLKGAGGYGTPQLSSAIIKMNDSNRRSKRSIGKAILDNCGPWLDKQFTFKRSKRIQNLRTRIRRVHPERILPPRRTGVVSGS